jgi:hypothetical protein
MINLSMLRSNSHSYSFLSPNRTWPGRIQQAPDSAGQRTRNSAIVEEPDNLSPTMARHRRLESVDSLRWDSTTPELGYMTGITDRELDYSRGALSARPPTSFLAVSNHCQPSLGIHRRLCPYRRTHFHERWLVSSTGFHAAGGESNSSLADASTSVPLLLTRCGIGRSWNTAARSIIHDITPQRSSWSMATPAASDATHEFEGLELTNTNERGEYTPRERSNEGRGRPTPRSGLCNMDTDRPQGTER